MTLKYILKKLRKFRESNSGISLVELVIAMSILSVAVVGFVSSFHYISRSIHISRARTLASNLAQEKIENMKDVSYHKLHLSTETSTDNNFNPALIYDDNNEAPETIEIGGLTFIRRTFVAFAEVDATTNDISTVTFNYPDTGMKELRVQVVWEERGNWKKMELENIYENPNIDPLNTVIDGCVDTEATPNCSNGGVAGALVEVVGTDWKDTADSNGEFTISVHAGTYTVRASSTNFYSLTQNFIGASTGTTVTQDFTLTAIGSGTVTGSPWISTLPVISMIATSTYTWIADGAWKDVEFVNLYNPTSSYLYFNQDFQLNYWDEDGARGSGSDVSDDYAHADFGFTFISTAIPPYHHYLIANTSFFIARGYWVNADAYYSGNHINPGEAGCLELSRISDGHLMDVVGWEDNDDNPPCFETDDIEDPTGGGFCTDGPGIGNAMVRISTHGDVSDIYAPAYDTDNNENDFLAWANMCNDALYTTMYSTHFFVTRPRSIAYGSHTAVTGKPAYGAFVSANDLIGPTTTVGQKMNSFSIFATTFTWPFPHFSLAGVSTGTWEILVSTGSEYGLYEDVVVTLGVTTTVPNGSTSPSIWQSGMDAENPGLLLSTSSTEGYISGEVVDVDNSPLNGIIVNAAGQIKTTGANGRYFAQVSTGLITISANPNNASAEYVESIKQVTIQTGVIAQQDFELSQGGIIQGFVTTDGSSILPGVEITATKSGAQYGSATSDSSGYFYIKNLGTGTYTITPALDTSEIATPVSFSSTVILNDTLFVGTFTVTGSLGELAGSVTLNGATLTSGALILASTETISSTPPLIVGSSSPAMTFIYAASSKADGTFTMEIRGSASDTYFVSAYVPDISGSGVTITTKTYSGVTITANETTPLNITVP
jgi:type II secretory pathway pseudopilin PulG